MLKKTLNYWEYSEDNKKFNPCLLVNYPIVEYTLFRCKKENPLTIRWYNTNVSRNVDTYFISTNQATNVTNFTNSCSSSGGYIKNNSCSYSYCKICKKDVYISFKNIN